MVERPGDAAERTEAGTRQVGYSAGPPDDDDGRDVLADQRAGMVDQRPPLEQRRRLVATEPTRLPPGEDRAQDQDVRSTRTGTDLPAGTWLCSALWLIGIRTLHSG